ncbi:MAG: alkaline phosphatase family protein [Rhodocyclaceae bacterium]|nr:alkaline phosphatase family protein [Rhodocyclaceae bacterium]
MSLIRRLFIGRFALAGLILALFLAWNALVRMGLLAFNGDWGLLHPASLLPVFGLGLVYDLAAGLWWLPLFALLAAFWPQAPHWQASWRVASVAVTAATLLIWVFIAASEFVFWNEFASRFNFIAVDYLIYTREVIGNIRESYDLRPILAGIAAVAGVLLAIVWRHLGAIANYPTPLPLGSRLSRFALFVALPFLGFVVVDPDWKEFNRDSQAAQLAGNGHYEFWHAFRNNEIDYAQFYRTETLARAYELLRVEFEHQGDDPHFVPHATMPVEREVRPAGPEKRLNVVLISVESLSAEFLGSLGNTQHLTPEIDKIAAESLQFTKLYATGTRTVRGLEAITLSIPPTPGNSIVKRPNNERLFTLGEVFNEKGYESLYLYGGYGYFDNMNAFFGGNGYTVIDRTAIAKDAIHYENIWGVADEDLFSLSLDELDKRHAASRPFFAHIMTTSNHRPFTYPAGRVDAPPGSGREGAVKYTDWAIGDFIRRARTKPWFANTVFVIVADHTASGRGKTDLPIENFHIPLLIWSPGHIKPARVDTLASQIDIAPTLLGLLNFGYRSRFFGQDILKDGPKHQRAFMANYQTVGYLEDNILVELRPNRRWRSVDAPTGAERRVDERGEKLRDEAIAYYQSASAAYKDGSLRLPAK